MESLTYFAYGSNMLMERLQARCTSARLAGIGSVEGYRLAFSKRSKDSSGKATLVASSDPSARVFGVMFEIAADDVTKLDRLEGRGKGYERIEGLPVFVHPDRAPLRATAYIAPPSNLDWALQPYDWYLNLIVKGAEQHGLPQEYLRTLSEITALVDTDPDRPSRLEAFDILSKLETAL